MKKSIIFSLAAIMVLAILNSCGTLSNSLSKDWPKDTRPVYLHNCPSDLVVTCKGINVEISKADYVKYKVVTYETSSMPAIFLPYKADADVVMTSASMGKSDTLHLKSGMWALSTGVNCCIAPVWGHALDYFTKNDRVLKPRVVDVSAFLSGKAVAQWTKP